MYSKKWNSLDALLLLLTGLSAQPAISGTMGAPPPDWRYVAAVSLGPVWAGNGQTQTLLLAPGIEKTYTVNNSNNTLFNGEAFLGFQNNFRPGLLTQFGLAVAATSNAHFSGVIWDDADPQFDNFTYQYNLQHTHLAFKGKMLYDGNYGIQPWLSASLGVAWNSAHQFNSLPLIFQAVPTPDFTNNSRTDFTYTVGAGVQKALNYNWQIGAGYEFADWGKSQFGRARSQTLGNGLAINHMYTNGVLFNITYLS